MTYIAEAMRRCVNSLPPTDQQRAEAADEIDRLLLALSDIRDVLDSDEIAERKLAAIALITVKVLEFE